MLPVLHLLLLCLALILVGSSWLGFLGLSVSIRRPGSRQKEPMFVDFDEFGSLPQLKNVYAAIGRCPTIVIARAANSTIVGYNKPQVSSPLQIEYGGSLFNTLVKNSTYMLVTGIGGDCRIITKYAKQLAINHTIEFNSNPTGLYVATKIGAFLQRMTITNGVRPYAVHTYIIDSCSQLDKSGKIYEIDAFGNIEQVYGGVAGSNHIKCRQLLLSQYQHNMTNINAFNIVQNILTTASKELAAHNDSNNDIKYTSKVLLIDDELIE